MFHGPAFIIDPPNTSYENGTFWSDTEFPNNYSFKAPRVRFITKIYHCNVRICSDNGAVCFDILYGMH